ncbi:hypothetical protein B0H10DRAFT_1407457 [Mycena sp. CBHHK59/15]|nr:hypothetical protein B0H10DRAFT_1407457 [Mycena sp. CBHHK59/15]
MPPKSRATPSALPWCDTFVRSIEAACAWTTAPAYLTGTQIAKKSVKVTIEVIELPREPIQAYGADELVEHWKLLGHWPEAVADKVTRVMEVRKANNPNRGAAHCEAGLLASLAYTPSSNTAQEPEFLTQALRVAREQLNDHHSIPIGVAKKCCPACRHLADVLEKDGRWKFDLPGSHARWHAWVPPHWLSTTVLKDLENRFISVVSNMVVSDIDRATGRVLTPTNNPDAQFYPTDEYDHEL